MGVSVTCPQCGKEQNSDEIVDPHDITCPTCGRKYRAATGHPIYNTPPFGTAPQPTLGTELIDTAAPAAETPPPVETPPEPQPVSVTKTPNKK